MPNLRTVHSNGTLIFSPFTADLYRSEIHSRDYRCRARNTVGQIISRVTNVNAGKFTIFFSTQTKQFYTILIIHIPPQSEKKSSKKKGKPPNDEKLHPE